MAAWYSNRLIRGLALIVLLLLTTVAVLTSYYHKILSDPLNIAPDTLYQIDRGIGLNGVLADFTRLQLTELPVWALKLHVRLTKSEGSLKAGEYAIPDQISSRDLIKLFRSGRVVERQITFPEGLTFVQWLDLLHGNQFVEREYNEADLDLILDGQHPEGRFFPDTYFFVLGESDMDILQRAHDKMEAVIETLWRERGAEHALRSQSDLLILASMIEKETGAESDRETIASVFTNRLRKKMKLQSDPTVIYGIDNFDGNITRVHLRQATPYNTYTIPRLPPTPICNPGLGSLNAALNPANTPYLYFVARGDGTSQFSTNLSDHNAAVTRYQKTARVRSTPK